MTSAQDCKPQNSSEMDESLGILTPEQMIEYLDSNAISCNLELAPDGKFAMRKIRVDQTPSPEDLPLDPVGVETFENCQITTSITTADPQMSESLTKTLPTTNKPKVANIFIASVTSIASIDNGYQGDGEMSRPASRGGTQGDDSSMILRDEMKKPRKKSALASLEVIPDDRNVSIVRRQDPMTDSDFFTESDADDYSKRGSRRVVQVIDGQLYDGQHGHGAQAELRLDNCRRDESSGMDSSGVYTDVENINVDAEEQMNYELCNASSSVASPNGSNDSIIIKGDGHQNKHGISVSSSRSQHTIEAHAATQGNEALAHHITQPTSSASTSSSINGSGTSPTTTVINSDVSSSSLSMGTVANSSSVAALCALNRNGMVCVNTRTKSTRKFKTAMKSTESATTTKTKTSSPHCKYSGNSKITQMALKKQRDVSHNQLLSNETIDQTSNKQSKASGEKTEAAADPPKKNKTQFVRKVTSNKWDKVMVSIAQNKAANATNHKDYSKVKSKVTSSLGFNVKRVSPIPPLSTHGVNTDANVCVLTEKALATQSDNAVTVNR